MRKYRRSFRKRIKFTREFNYKCSHFRGRSKKSNRTLIRRKKEFKLSRKTLIKKMTVFIKIGLDNFSSLYYHNSTVQLCGLFLLKVLAIRLIVFYKMSNFFRSQKEYDHECSKLLYCFNLTTKIKKNIISSFCFY